MNYYLDIETTGLNPFEHKIITIQYMELERNTAKPTGPLKILKEWESDEKTILTEFISNSGINDDYKFSFIPVGFNLQFEHSFFYGRCIANNIKPINILNRPFLDLKIDSPPRFRKDCEYDRDDGCRRQVHFLFPFQTGAGTPGAW